MLSTKAVFLLSGALTIVPTAILGVLAQKSQPPLPILALTPPMGWNSWNAFEKDIDEAKIKATADLMVSSGMRDAGYVTLVLDDAWMGKDRDANDCLQADRVKFPNGMKAVGDYIHSKGLKFGIYEDRGKLTCQGLPGSLGHEKIDMETFAEWGVDYIKMDSCYAESNGHASPDDYGLYRKSIDATRRPMVLSISDFGNAAWAWGGKESSQLWRTSYDIYPWMDSIYSCAETSGGSNKIHPAFNGLWQFAGPGHWNDPDMLQVGNITNVPEKLKLTANRAHFGLWCILAAPLMVGTDLRSMKDEIKMVLTAPEVIAVDQDKRGIQGYKVFTDGGIDIYNKPLSDGTTAVFMLNKEDKKSTVTVLWKQIGLDGTQPVRDLWERKSLGKFKDSFSVELGKHENRLLKIGGRGRPMPAPKPVPLVKYTITRTGTTYLSDLYYIWKADNTPVYDAAFGGGPIVVDGHTLNRGLGCRGKSSVMFLLNGKGDRFQATVSVGKTSKPGGTGRFRVYDGDFFSNKVLWDSGKMTTDIPAKEVNIDVKKVKCLMLVFEGDQMFGNWGSARVRNEAKSGSIPSKD
jgi:hypothetical protein